MISYFKETKKQHLSLKMPQLYLREAQPFLALDPKKKMEESIQKNLKKGSSAVREAETSKERRLSKRRTSLIVSDAVILMIEMLQILALIQSMSLKWSWPESWIKYANFIFIFNLDIWEFVKVQSGSYTQLQGVETASSEMPFSYNFILIGWGILIFVLAAVFITIYISLRRRQPPYLMVHLAKLELVILFIAQVIALPLGTAVFRLFQCPEADVMAVYNDISCHKRLYWAYFVPALIVTLFLFGVIPIWMVYRIYHQRLAASTDHHEEYMKLKEVEYMAGLDVVWAVQGFPLFSSFRLLAIYYRSIVHTVKLVLLIIFSAGSPYIYNQAIALSVILSLCALFVAIVRPFRVTSFNVSLGLSLTCLAGDSIFGAVLASVSPALVESPWLVEPFSYSILISINVILGCILISWLIYMMTVSTCCHRFFPNDPLWPVLPEYEYEVEGMATYKFMAAVLRGRAILDACMKAPSVFAPVHHLARQIEIVNAFCREAEKTRDGLHLTLLQLLDDMIDVHRRLEPVSLFADTVKENIRQNAANFVLMMPGFTRRLAQRDYDLILVNPVKKRLLMKMYIVGMFTHGCHDRPVRNPVTQQALRKLWDEIPDIVEPKDELEYKVDLYPEPLTGPDTEMLYVSGTVPRPLELMDLEDSDEEESLSAFLARVPPLLQIKESDSRLGSMVSMRMSETSDKEKSIPEEQSLLDQPIETTLPQQDELTLQNAQTRNSGLDGMTEVEMTQSQPTSTKSDDTGVVNPAFISDSDSVRGVQMLVSSVAETDSSEQTEKGKLDRIVEKPDSDGDDEKNSGSSTKVILPDQSQGGSATDC